MSVSSHTMGELFQLCCGGEFKDRFPSCLGSDSVIKALRRAASEWIGGFYREIRYKRNLPFDFKGLEIAPEYLQVLWRNICLSTTYESFGGLHSSEESLIDYMGERVETDMTGESYPDIVSRTQRYFEHICRNSFGFDDVVFTQDHIVPWGIYVDPNDASLDGLSRSMDTLFLKWGLETGQGHSAKDKLYLALPCIGSEEIIISRNRSSDPNDTGYRFLGGGVLMLVFSPSSGGFTFQKQGEYRFFESRRPSPLELVDDGTLTALKERMSLQQYVDLIESAITFLEDQIWSNRLDFIREYMFGGTEERLLVPDDALWSYRSNMRRPEIVRRDVLEPLQSYLSKIERMM